MKLFSAVHHRWRLKRLHHLFFNVCRTKEKLLLQTCIKERIKNWLSLSFTGFRNSSQNEIQRAYNNRAYVLQVANLNRFIYTPPVKKLKREQN